MYLLNNLRISHILRTKSDFDIVNFDDRCLQHTSYYFRLGRRVLESENDETSSTSNQELTIKPNQYIIVKSLERFKLGESKFAILGSNSALVGKGLLMNHSPFIDPLFNSYLTVGLQNLTDEDIVISNGEIIGKISFFDISETFPIAIREGSIQQHNFNNNCAAYDDGPLYENEIDE